MDSGSVNAISLQDTKAGIEISENENLPATIDATEERGLSVVHDQGKELHNPNSIFYDPVVRDDIFYSPFCSVSDNMRSEGLEEEDLRASLLSVATMISPKLGHPLSLIIVDNTSKAAGLLSLTTRLVPKDTIFECVDLTAEMLFMHQSNMSGKTIVCQNFAGLKKARPYLDSLVEHGTATMQSKMTSKITTRFDEVKVKGPVGLVTIVSDPQDIDFNGTNIIKVHRKPETAGSLSAGTSKNALDIQTYRTVAFFNRLRARNVDIPYMDQIQASMKDARVPITSSMMRPLVLLISIMAHINNPLPVTRDEIAAAIYGMKDAHLAGQQGAITATKVDYYYAAELLGNRIHLDSSFSTDRQIRIFEGLKRQNIGRVEASFAKQDSDIDKLSAILKNPYSWVDRNQLFDELNKITPEISSSTLNNELQVLVDKGIIERQKQPKSTQFKYFITTMHADNSVQLPDASAIVDGVYQGRSVRVVSLLTGKVVEIPGYKDLSETEIKMETPKFLKVTSPKAKEKKHDASII